ncbi:MAG: 50S ribosomal protein L25 [Ignavibacteria bacterium]
MAEVVLNATERQVSRKSANKQLRKNGRIPGVYYSKNEQSIVFDVAETAIKPLVFTSEAHIISLKVGDRDGLTCVIKDIQFDPVTDKVVHFDLLGIKSGEKVQIEVPIAVTGNSSGVRAGGVLQIFLHKLDIECLPDQMPEHLEINISNTGLGESVHARDLKFDNVVILNAPESVVLSVVAPKIEKEVAEGKGKAEPEVISKGKVDKAG